MQGNKTYLIEFTIHYVNGTSVQKKGKMKNCVNGVHAQVKLEEGLKKGSPGFKQLTVQSCKEDIMSIFDNMFGNTNSNPFTGFEDIFGGCKK